MPSAADFAVTRSGNWNFWLLKGAGEARMLDHLAALADRQPYAKHPQTLLLSWPPNTDQHYYFAKIFHRRQGAAQIKDWLRATKARRFWQQGLALAAAGFHAPPTVLFGERGRWGLAERSLVLTEKIAGRPAPLFLSGLSYGRDDPAQVKIKRGALVQLGRTLRRFHDLGFVHGDLVASNIFVAGQNAAAPVFYLMDNDRTRRLPAWLAAHWRRRNLVQLNRMPLAHITLQDRMRWFHAYLGVAKLGARDRQLARWLEVRTRKRRQECDGVDPKGSFRRLMRWAPSAAEAERSE